ncbi:ribose-phosphate pyrophosphokinase [Persicimonas caeni]|uniref:ribose-phosphate diphosphokinase n=1 Tax=Persicimonas caeni TaxID=2292766 RepID=A0A4Y6PR88_PERCE|nr:ribose-phosphate pyrophosphokinase [Persicimonas caeni]QDG50537.1 ribose-phosphate pyrophosphokinase [Persicimonas caeni]QED31758.1 ribose-phosphate pyrophosphokinase [Persicimonas caeni]
MTGSHRSPAEPLAVFSLASGGPLVERICARLGVEPGRHEERDFEDGEHKIRPLESVRGRDVYVVESLFGDDALSVNDKLVRMLFFLAALRDAGARRLTAVAPYLCYSRKDMRTKPRDPVSSRYVASLFEAAAIDRMVTVDVHNPAAFQNAFRIPTEHLTAASAFVDTFASVLGERPAVVVSPDAGGVKRAERFRQALEKRLDATVGFAFLEKFRSEGVVRGGTVVGDTRDRVAIIIDDLISSGGTLARAAKSCREQGATAVYAAATHGVFSANASVVLSESALEKVVILDTIPPRRVDPELLEERIEVVDCAPLLADAIRRLHDDESLVELTGL